MNEIEILQQKIKDFEHEIDALDLEESNIKNDQPALGEEIHAKIIAKLIELDGMYSELKKLKTK